MGRLREVELRAQLPLLRNWCTNHTAAHKKSAKSACKQDLHHDRRMTRAIDPIRDASRCSKFANVSTCMDETSFQITGQISEQNQHPSPGHGSYIQTA